MVPCDFCTTKVAKIFCENFFFTKLVYGDLWKKIFTKKFARTKKNKNSQNPKLRTKRPKTPRMLLNGTGSIYERAILNDPVPFSSIHLYKLNYINWIIRRKKGRRREEEGEKEGGREGQIKKLKIKTRVKARNSPGGLVTSSSKIFENRQKPRTQITFR